jgi:hypothetical protein
LLSIGFRIEWSDAEITDCSIRGTSGHPTQIGALFYLDSGSSIRRTSIENFSQDGVYCVYSNHGVPDLGTDSSKGYNKIVSDLGYYVYYNPDYSPAESLKAQYNWWGEYPPDPNRFYGPVVYMPALTSEDLIPLPVFNKAANDGTVPQEFQLLQNYPNPFNPVTSIQFTVVSSQSPVHATLKIYNILGQLVRTLMDEEKSEGSYTVYWDGRNMNGEIVSSGIYFYKFETSPFTDVKKMVFMR